MCIRDRYWGYYCQWIRHYSCRSWDDAGCTWRECWGRPKETGLSLIHILTAHEPFTSAEDAVETERDIVSNRVAVRYNPRRALVGDTDNGKALKERIQELKQLLDAYRKGVIKAVSYTHLYGTSGFCDFQTEKWDTYWISSQSILRALWNGPESFAGLCADGGCLLYTSRCV